jgi:hypothetical protein
MYPKERVLEMYPKERVLERYPEKYPKERLVIEERLGLNG